MQPSAKLCGKSENLGLGASAAQTLTLTFGLGLDAAIGTGSEITIGNKALRDRIVGGNVAAWS